MSFLNPSVLIALAAVSIPVIIHLLNLRKLKKVEFSTLMFLKEIQKSKMKRIKLKQLLLLLFRILLITFLVLAFSKPVFRSFGGNPGSKSKTTTLIFLDDSFSMSAVENNRNYFSEAKKSAEKILELHKETDEIYFIPFSRIGMKNSSVLYKNFGDISDTLKNLKLSEKFTSAEDVLIFSDDLLSVSKSPVKEIFIISDFQKSNFKSYSEGLIKYPSLTENSVNLFLVKAGAGEINNLSLDSFQLKSGINETGKPVNVKINVNNYSSEDALNKNIKLYIENKLVSEKVTDVKPGMKKELDFSFKPGKSGFVNGYFELTRNEYSEDEFIQDNKYYFSVFIPEQFDVKLISDNSSGINFLNTGFITAGKLLSDSVKNKSKLFNITTAYDVNENLYGSDVAFISDKKTFTDKEAEILKKYVSDGGGLFIFPGKDADINNYNNTVLNKLNLPRINKLNLNTDINLNLRFEKIDFENPLLTGIFRNPDLNITHQKFIVESPAIRSYYDLLLNEKSVPVISLNNENPFLTETKLSDGKVILASVSAVNDMSDFPLKSIFLPLILRSAYYLSSNPESQTEYVTGENNYVAVTEIKNIKKLVLPDNTSAVMEFDTGFSEQKINYVYIPYTEFTGLSGKYILEDSSGSSSSFSMNINNLESETAKMDFDEIRKYYESRGIQSVYIPETGDDIKSKLNESGKGIELWKYMLFLAVIFLAAEIILSRNLQKS